VTAIDVHTHMLSREWLNLLRQHGKPRYEVRRSMDASEALFLDGAPFMTPEEGHFDYAYRIARMDEARVDLAIVSLTCPNVFWGSAEVSLGAAKIVNDDMAAAQRRFPDRLRWMASLPWQHAELAVRELGRAHRNGAVGVMVLANINGRSLTDPAFAPIWRAIDELVLPVLVHPTAPPGAAEMDVRVFNLIASVGFMFDTTLAIARMVFDGFFDTYPNLKIIAPHAGGALPYLVGRLDQCFDQMNACRVKISTHPNEYLRRIYYDSVTYHQEALNLCVQVGGDDRVLYGSDYPHNIGDMEGCLQRVNALPEVQAKKIRSVNAERLFKL
jgi:aminocarboxymuconate-semialdehyde decarboxylase